METKLCRRMGTGSDFSLAAITPQGQRDWQFPGSLCHSQIITLPVFLGEKPVPFRSMQVEHTPRYTPGFPGAGIPYFSGAASSSVQIWPQLALSLCSRSPIRPEAHLHPQIKTSAHRPLSNWTPHFQRPSPFHVLTAKFPPWTLSSRGTLSVPKSTTQEPLLLKTTTSSHFTATTKVPWLFLTHLLILFFFPLS